MKVILICALLLSGCMALQGPLAYRYVPTISNEPQLPFHVAMEKFADDRPVQVKQPEASDTTVSAQPTDRDDTARIEPVAEQVTVAIMEDFQESRLFESIVPFPDAGSSLSLRGAVKRFTWEHSNVGAIPIIGWLMGIVGAPIHFMSATAAIEVGLFDRQGKKLGTYAGRSEVKDSFNLYYGPSESGAELAQALRSASQQIKVAIRADYAAGKFNGGAP